MKLLILTLLFTLIACVAPVVKEVEVRNEASWRVAEGAWVGQMTRHTSHNFPEHEEWEEIRPEIYFLNCDGKIELWSKDGEPVFYMISADWKFQQSRDSFSISFMVDGGDWIESQFWGFSYVNDNRMLVQMNRLVSNPGLEDDNATRAWGVSGFGEFKKQSDHCDVFE